jgi:uncharacterized membrane protein YphA (DoxX/SURF4 family)
MAADFADYRVNSEPRVLSIARITIGLLFLEHGLAKIVDFPHQQNHWVFELLTLNPGLQGLLN